MESEPMVRSTSLGDAGTRVHLLTVDLICGPFEYSIAITPSRFMSNQNIPGICVKRMMIPIAIEQP
jgi:hypothetical protein